MEMLVVIKLSANATNCPQAQNKKKNTKTRALQTLSYIKATQKGKNMSSLIFFQITPNISLKV